MNYEEIVAATIAYADRHDIEVDQNMDTFVIMVEARINRLLKTREQTSRSYVDALLDQAGNGVEYYSLPPDYAGMRDIQVNSDIPSLDHKSYPVDYITPILMNRRRNGPYAGRHYYTVIADQIQIFPTIEPPSTMELVYYQKVPNLNATANENWLSVSHPDAYIAGMTAEVEIFAKNYEAGDGWYTRVSTIIGEMKTSDVEERWAGAPLQTRLG